MSTGSARRQQVGHLDVRGRVRAQVGDGDGEGDDVADVRRRVADRLGDRQVGLLGVSVALAALLPVSGSNWSAWLTVAVLVWAAGLVTVAVSVSVCGVPGMTVPTVQTPVVAL